jgi:hypothetical protein
VHCTHGFNRTGAMLVHYAQRVAPWPKLNENVKEFATKRPPGIYKPEYVKELFDEYLERRFSTTTDPPLPEWKRGVIRHPDAPPLDENAVPSGDLFSQKTNPEYAKTFAESLAPRPGSGVSDELASSRSKTTADGNLDGTHMHHDDVLGTATYEGQVSLFSFAYWQFDSRRVLYRRGRFETWFPTSAASTALGSLGPSRYPSLEITWIPSRGTSTTSRGRRTGRGTCFC